VGKALFDRIWTIAGASNQASDGLGPLFNARSCASCHARGGAGRMPGADGDPRSAGLVLRLPAHSAYGRQLQTSAVPGQRVEGRLLLSWRTQTRQLPDGTVVPLRAPVWRVGDAGYGPVPAHGSLRLAPDLAGLGQVDAALAGQGGHPFGLKGTHASLDRQVEEALLLDLGLSNPGRNEAWGDCTGQQAACRQAMQGAVPPAPELAAGVVRALVAYVRSLPPPRPAGPPDPMGAGLFSTIGCAGCHRPSIGVLQPYSDFHTHDLGPGLADGDPADPKAARWRTAPLWGLGEKLRNGQPLLHDGRARDGLEAILWHDGDAQAASSSFAALAAPERDRLLSFLKGL
jgi:CxxC motif-containing protein (DUF1111 family)